MSRAPAYELARCLVCGTSDTRELASAEGVRAELEELWAFHGRRLRPETPPRALMDRVAFSQRPPLRVVQCRTCGLVYRNPAERGFEVTATYEDDAPAPGVLESLFENQRRAYRAQARRLTTALGRAGTVLEVGSYVGAFLAAAREAGWQAEGLDINERASAFARAKGFHVTLGDLGSYARRGHLDAVAIWNCFDQLPDARQAAARARALLDDGGVLALRIPNGAFYARVRPLLDGPLRPVARELLAQNNLLGFPYRFGFSPEAVRRLLEECGFEVRRVVGDVLVMTADEWTRRWAAVEERVVKAAWRRVAVAEVAPWMEVYAVAG